MANAKMTVKEMLDVLQAFVEGATIQCSLLTCGHCRWEPCSAPAWDFSQFVYRVKPTPRTRWANEYLDKPVDSVGRFGSLRLSSETAAAVTGPGNKTQVTKWVEVLEN